MKIEPHADMRQGATMLYQFYIALMDAGFSQSQAMELIKVQLSAAAQQNGNGGGDDEA